MALTFIIDFNSPSISWLCCVQCVCGRRCETVGLQKDLTHCGYHSLRLLSLYILSVRPFVNILIDRGSSKWRPLLLCWCSMASSSVCGSGGGFLGDWRRLIRWFLRWRMFIGCLLRTRLAITGGRAIRSVYIHYMHTCIYTYTQYIHTH